MRDRAMRWARSRRGACSIAAAIAVTAERVSAGSVSAASALPAVVVLLPFTALLVWFVATVWEDKSKPAPPRFARLQPPSGSRQLREDGNATLLMDRLGFLFEKRWFFVGTGCPPVRLTPEFVKAAGARMRATPVLVASTAARRYWWYREAFIWENQGLSERDVMAMLHDRERRHSRDLQRAHVLLDVEQGLSTEVPRQRPAIPREVRHAVFTRDGGRCVECASDFDIQYDHVIPWSMGGADTIQNLQILCAPCNQRKGASI